MALTDTENKAGTSLLSGGVTEPLTSQPGEEGVQLAFGGGIGSKLGRFATKFGDSNFGQFLGNTFFGKDLFSSRKVLQELESGKRDPIDIEDIFVPPFLRGTETEKRAKTKVFGAKEVPQSEQMLDIGKTKEERDAKAQEFLENRKIQAVPKKGLLTDFRVTGSQGDDKLPNEQSILNSIEAISQTHRGKIDEASRGKITQAETQQLADLVGASPKVLINNILGRKRGQTIQFEGLGMAETMLAARELLVSEIRKLDELSELAMQGGERDALAFRQQFELVSQLQLQIKGSQTEIARALGQFKIPVRQDGPPNVMHHDIAGLLDQYGGLEDIKTMVTLYRNAQTDAQKAQLARGKKGIVGKSIDAFYEVWINMLLSSPVTHVKNVAGAFLTTFAHVPETFVAAGVGSVRRNVLGQEGGVQFGEANAELFGALMAFGDAWKAASTAWSTGETPILGSKIEFTQGKKHQRAFSAEGFEIGTFGNAVDGIGSLMTMGRIPTGALEFEDTWFKVVGQRMSLYQQGYREAKTRGLQGENFGEFVANFINNPPEQALIDADDHARYITLQNKVTGVGKDIQGLRKIPGARFFIPFFKTPYNAFKYAFKERTPLGLFTSDIRETISTGMRPDATPQQKAASDTALARLSMGSMTAGLIAMYAAQGRITGNGSTDGEYRSSLRRTGWQPYSIRVGDKYYSYAGAEPFSSIMGLAADMSEVMMHGNLTQGQINKMALAIGVTISNQLTDKTFMSGFNNLVNMLQDPERYGGMTAESFQRSLVPRVFAQAKKTGIGLPELDIFGVPLGVEADPLVRDTNSFLTSIMAQLPGFSSDLPPRRNVWGQPIHLSGSYGPDVISPIYSSHRGPNYLMGKENDVELTYILDEMFVSARYGPSKMPDDINVELPLSLEERNEYHAMLGKETVKEFKKWYRNKTKVRKFEKLRDYYLQTGSERAHEEIRLMFDEIFSEARYDGEKKFLKRTSLGRAYDRRLKKLERTQKQDERKFKRKF